MRKGARAAGGPMSMDERAGYMPLPLPPPGDPAAAPGLAPFDMTWTVVADASALVTAAVLDAASPPVFGFAVREADRAGGVSVERCDALKVPPGAGGGAAAAAAQGEGGRRRLARGGSRAPAWADAPRRSRPPSPPAHARRPLPARPPPAPAPPGEAYSLLKSGVAVTNTLGMEIRPEMVVGPLRPGRVVRAPRRVVQRTCPAFRGAAPHARAPKHMHRPPPPLQVAIAPACPDVGRIAALARAARTF